MDVPPSLLVFALILPLLLLLLLLLPLLLFESYMPEERR